MTIDWKKFALILFAAAFIVGWCATPTQAVWHVFLDEHFDLDQQNPNLRWPWITDIRNQLGWHENPQRPHWPHRPTEGDPTDYCWGLQDFIYNTHINPQSPIHQSIWCAYTNRNLINEPRWPEFDDYMAYQNAWVWWGPVSLENAETAAVSFWLYLDLDHYARDSLSAVAVANPNLLTLNGNAFRRNVPIGKVFPRRLGNDWVWQYFYLDSLVVDGNEDELVSLMGEEEVYIAFVWQSDRFDIAGRGAFIDDVIFSWDDGLFDIFPLEALFGYPINEDQTDWNDEIPEEDDEVMFKLDYRVLGVGETPLFNINLYLDEELIYSDSVSHEGAGDTSYTIYADTLWTATPDSHLIRWEIDTPVEDGGVVEEGNENNNFLEIPFVIVYNPPPIFEILTPDVDSTRIAAGVENAIFEYSITDTLEDNDFRVFFYWSEDTTGFAENIDIVDDFGWIGREDVGRGEHTYE